MQIKIKLSFFSRSLSSSAYEESTNFSSSKSISSLNSTNITDSSNESRPSLELLSSKTSKSSPNEETDSLDVLSLCDEEFENDDLSELSSNIKKYDSPKLSKYRSCEQDGSGFLEGVELRNKCRSFNGSSRRKEKGRSCPFGNNGYLKTNQFSNSLPLTKRHAKVNNSQRESPQLKALTIPIEQEPFNDIVDLPSPSSTSLNSSKNFVIDLGTKSNSAPILMKNNFVKDDFSCQNVSFNLLLL